MSEEKFYRLLNVGEIIKEGDEMWDVRDVWDSHLNGMYGQKVTAAMFRRPIPRPADAPKPVIEGWVNVYQANSEEASIFLGRLFTSRDEAIRDEAKSYESYTSKVIACIKVSFKRGDGL